MSSSPRSSRLWPTTIVKVTLGEEPPKVRKVMAAELAERTGSHLAQVIGRIALLYRRRVHRLVIAFSGKIEAPNVK